MNATCIICSDPLTPTSDVYATPCGHIFHFRCLMRWVEKARTCPQCRSNTTEATIHRIYFNLANTEGIVDSVETLHFKLEGLRAELRLKDKDVEIYKEKHRSAKKQTVALKSVLCDSQGDAKVASSAIQALKGQIDYFKVKSKESDDLCEEIGNLKDKLKEYDGIVSVLNEAKGQASDMLRHNRDADSLNILVSTLKTELMETRRKSKQVSASLKDTNNSMSHYKKELLKVQQENEKLKFDAEVHGNCAKQQLHLKKRLSDLENNSVKLPCTSSAPEENTILIVDDLPPDKSRHVNEGLSVVDDLVETDRKRIAAVESHENNGDDKFETADSVEPRNELKRCRQSSAVSKTKFRKLAPNKKPQEFHLINDE